jgi:SAM-dependent methyltransferase
VCQGALVDTPSRSLTCRSCHRAFAQHWGIPDLRTGDDPYLSRDADLVAATRLADRAADLDFGALYASYYEGNEKVTTDQAARFTRGVLAAAARAESTLATWNAMAGADVTANGPVVDLGCGTAPLAVAVARRGASTLGIDVGLRWLVSAAVRAGEAGVDVPLICANAESLPLRPASCGMVAGESVMENVADPERAFAETRRVLRPRGWLCLTMPNRFSLGPDPHVGVLAGGWWPDAALRRHVARRGAVFPRRTLFSSASLDEALRRNGFDDIRIGVPPVSEAQRRGLSPALQAAVGMFNFSARNSLGRAMMLRIGPSLACTARGRA